MEQDIRRRRGEIFFLWLSVLSVIVGYALTSTASSDHPNDIWFIIGVLSGFLGSAVAFGFVLYISICSEYHYQKTVSVPRGFPESKTKTVPREYPENDQKENMPRKHLKNEDLSPDYSENGEKETLSREFPVNGKMESVAREYPENDKETLAREYPENGKRDITSGDSLEKLENLKPGCKQCKTTGKIDLELQKLQLAEYEEVQEILNKATRMLQEFALIAANLEFQRKQIK